MEKILGLEVSLKSITTTMTKILDKNRHKLRTKAALTYYKTDITSEIKKK